MKKALLSPSLLRNEVIPQLHDIASDMVAVAELHSLSGDLWEIMFVMWIAEDENTIGHLSEFGSEPTGSIASLAARELWDLHRTVWATRKLIDKEDIYENLRVMKNYVPSGSSRGGIDEETVHALSETAGALCMARTSEEMYRSIVGFYAANGSGLFALYKAFRWSRQRTLEPLAGLDSKGLKDLVGYESQKAELLINTDMFIRGKEANNVLLFGDSGTGKSSSVRALLNEPGFVRQGLRMIELHKDQLADLPEILDIIRFRNYRFIIFMDDLSFEEFEVEYKHLKALIEGGLEPKPANTLIYATSNRRNIIREVWSDRKSASDDVHGGDTMREKLSLADRFGLSIWYGSVSKDEYMDIVRSIAARSGVSMDDGEMERLALRWEIERGGFTGRTARQFVNHLLLQG
ncbi:MAG: ATP-binding protein [Synergistaceae bacterium]|jgi:predicted AAA+ superfamily ATPase|nr:ATP-binding protein [Synergistaceae bacterium]